jgi:fatty acid desaturase
MAASPSHRLPQTMSHDSPSAPSAPSVAEAGAPGALRRRWHRHEVPTLLLIALVYAVWAALVWWHRQIPPVALFLLGGYTVQLHGSLQHEAIHAMRHVPRALRLAAVWPPLNLWLPYALFERSHSAHHVNFHLTHPGKDTESAYHAASAWNGYGRLRRAVARADQTLAFRMVAGPWLRLAGFARAEVARLARGDRSHLGIWARHALGVAVLLGIVTQLADMTAWKYVLCFVYPNMMLGALRAFTEHRWEASPHGRVAIVESNALFGLLYLNNNFHHVHHRAPTMPWYRIPAHFRAHRAAILAANGHFYYRGYGQIARRYLLRPVFEPVHPRW